MQADTCRWNSPNDQLAYKIMAILFTCITVSRSQSIGAVYAQQQQQVCAILHFPFSVWPVNGK